MGSCFVVAIVMIMHLLLRAKKVKEGDKKEGWNLSLSLLAVNHFVVFLLGTEPLDPAYGAAVYVCWDAAVNLAGLFIVFTLENKKNSGTSDIKCRRP
jgi:hypothetical protein